MNTTKTKLLTVLGAIAFGTAYWAPTASAQDPIVAVGQIDISGNPVNTANTVGGIVTSTRNGFGDYHVIVTTPGAFAGASIEDFVFEVTCLDATTDDQIAKISPVSVTSDVLTVEVHIDDVESSASPGLGVATDNAFFFSIYRIPGSFAGKGSTKHLLSTGQVHSNGSLLSAFQLEGLVVNSTNTGVGDYEVTFTNPGAFAGMGEDDFVPILSLRETVNFDEAIRGDITSVDANSVTLRVRTDDVQAFSGGVDQNAGSPVNNPFHFTLYQIPVDAGPAKSRALVSLGSVDSVGDLISGGTFGGGASAANNGTGDYTVILTSPGAFAGRTSEEFAAQVMLLQGFSADESIGADIVVANANTLLLNVRIADVEQAGTSAGVALDAAFAFLVYDAVAAYQGDSQISNKPDLTQYKGDGIYNNNGANQKIRVKLRDKPTGRPGKGKYFFLVENDGNAADDLGLRANKSGKDIRMKYIRLTGGNQNVTAALTAGTLTLDDLRPGEQVQFRAKAKFKPTAKKNRKNLYYRATSVRDATKQDATKATLKRKG